MSDERSDERSEDADDTDHNDRGGSIVGKVEEKLGWLTADRQQEAKGRLRQAEAADLPSDPEAVPADEDAAAADAVDQAELQIRDEYGDLAPGVGRDKS